MAEIKTKKVKVSKQEDSEPIDEQVALSIEKLSEIQEQLDKINDEESDKVLEVEKEFSKIRKPVYDRRNEVIKSIPGFWFTALAGHPALNMLISEEDQKILKHLKSLDVDDLKNVKAGYSITFTFEPNPYFENTELVKTYTFLEEGTAEITATPIKWKEGKEPNIGVDHEKEGKKRALDVESFFTWFCETQAESLDSMQDDIAEIIKDDLWTNPLSYATMDEDEDGDDSEVEDDEQEDDEEDDDEEDEDANDGANES